MKLSPEAVKGYITGCIALPTEEDGSILLQRFLDVQREGHEDDFNIRQRTYMSAGATLDLHTDATFLRLTVDGQREKHLLCEPMDILVDGVLTRQETVFFGTETPNNYEFTPFGPQTIHVDLPAGEHRVTLVFGPEGCYRIRDLELSDGATHRSHDYTYRWLAFGDSITHGFTAALPSNSYTHITARLLNAKLLNHAISGEESRDTKVVPGTYPEVDFVTIAYGTNDYVTYSPQQLLHHISTFHRKAHEAFSNIPVFVLLPIWRKHEDKATRNFSLPKVRETIAAEAAKYPNFHVIDCSKFVPPMAEFFGEDICVHPNFRGMPLYALNLHVKILEVLQK